MYNERYYLKTDWQDEWAEVTKAQFIAAEQNVGFYSKFGPNHPATGGFSGNGIRGRIDYETEEEKDAMFNDEHYANAVMQRKFGVLNPTIEQMRTVCENLKNACNASSAKPEFREFLRVVHPASVLQLIEQRNRLIDAIQDVAIRSLKYCEQRYDHDNQARLNLEALLTDVEAAQ